MQQDMSAEAIAQTNNFLNKIAKGSPYGVRPIRMVGFQVCVLNRQWSRVEIQWAITSQKWVYDMHAIQSKMIKVTLLLLLLTIGTFQQQTLDSQVSASSSDVDVNSLGSANTGGSGTRTAFRPMEGSSQGGSNTQSQATQATQSAAPVQTAKVSSASDTITDWTFIQGQKSQLTGTNWKFPGNDYQLYPVGYQTSFTITFNTDCPHSPVKLTFAACGYAFVYINGHLVQTWLPPYPSYHTITIPQHLLKCGCNTIKILVYNFCCPTPAAITYTLSQDVSHCYNCNNTGVTFYNRTSCQCECVEECACKNSMRRWYGYPACGCKCRDGPKTCPSGQYWDWSTCNCTCGRKCCPQGYKQDPSTCGCVRQFCEAEQCNWPQIWNQNTCRCECSNFHQCTSPQVWSNSTCGCICPNGVQSCPAGHRWDSSSCSCVCQQQQQCNWPQIWSSSQCGCICSIQPQQCPWPQVWSDSQCRCICQPQQCPWPQVWSNSQCKCVCQQQPCCQERPCGFGQQWSWSSCSCVCSNCPPGGLPTNPTGSSQAIGVEGNANPASGGNTEASNQNGGTAGGDGDNGGIMVIDSSLQMGN